MPRIKGDIPQSIADAIMEMSTNQSLVLTFPTIEQARRLSKRIDAFIREKQGEGILALEYIVKVHTHPNGNATIEVSASEPIKAELVEISPDGESISIIKTFNITGV